MRIILLAAALAFALSGCGKSKTPSGLNFISVSKPLVVLNEQGATWRIFVDGTDRTEAVGLSVKLLDESPYELVQVEIAHPDDVLRGRFSLQYSATGYLCTGACPTGQVVWKLSKP